MNLNLFSKLIFVALLAFVISSFVYFAFGNIYSSKILNDEDFQEQFHSGIYKYRILSGYFLLWIYDFISNLNIDYQIFKLKFFNKGSEPKMFISFYILNTLFLILSSTLMVLITETKNFVATSSEKLLMIAAGIFVVGLTQFVIVPYDVSSYFFLLLFFYVLIQYVGTHSTRNLILLSLIIVISTLNRESSALSISLAATLLYGKFGLKKEAILPVAVLGITFIAVYLGMRFFTESFSTNDGNLFIQNLTQPKNILGILFWLVFFLFTFILAKDRTSKKNILMFHLFALPYIFMCIYTGILYEIRLYVPLFITSLLLARVQFSKID